MIVEHARLEVVVGAVDWNCADVHVVRAVQARFDVGVGAAD